MAAGSSRVKLDLNSPEFQEVFFGLELSELKQIVGSLRRLRELDWNPVYRCTGFKWEPQRGNCKHEKRATAAGPHDSDDKGLKHVPAIRWRNLSLTTISRRLMPSALLTRFH